MLLAKPAFCMMCLNRMPLHAQLLGCRSDEAQMGIAHLKQIASLPDCQDLIVADRNYPSDLVFSDFTVIR